MLVYTYLHIIHFIYFSYYSGKALMTPSNVIKAIAFAGNALKKQGTKPLQNPLAPSRLQIDLAASFHRGNIRWPSPRPLPSGSVMMRCLITSEGYDVIQKIWAERPPAQKLTAGVDRWVELDRKRLRRSYDPHQKKKNDRKRSVAVRPWYIPRIP